MKNNVELGTEASPNSQCSIARLFGRIASGPLLETIGNACMLKISRMRSHFENELRLEEEGNWAHAHIQAGVAETIQLFPPELTPISTFWRQVSKA